MNCPRLPNVPSGRVTQIDPSWFLRLNECLQFAMTHPRGDGSTIFQDAGGTLRSIAGGGVPGSGEDPGYANYFKVTATGWTESGRPEAVSITDGGNPDSNYCGITDVDKVPVGTLASEGGFAEGYICLRLVVDTSGSTPEYAHEFEFSSSEPDPWEPVVILAEIVRQGNQRAVVQRWTGGMIYWRSRFVIGFGRGRYN